MAVSIECTSEKSNATTSTGSLGSSINGVNKNDCRWLGCKTPGPFSSVDLLVEHVEKQHLTQFHDTDFVTCLWQGCKVFNRPFEKKDWLPQHMRRHTNEKPHKCFMNGCNMAFWSPHALQTHVQLHFKPSPVKHKKTAAQSNKSATTTSSECTTGSSSHPLIPAANHEGSRSLGGPTMLPNGDSTQMKDPISLPFTRDDGFSTLDLKRRVALKVKIPLNSNVKLSVIEACCQTPVPINGSIVHDDNIDLSTHSIIRKTLLGHLLVPPPSSSSTRYGTTSGLTDARRNYISLKGKVIGRRSTSEIEYLVRWSPMLVPDSWVPISNYTGMKIVAINDLSQCQKSALVQCKYLSSSDSNRFNFGNRKRKRV